MYQPDCKKCGSLSQVRWFLENNLVNSIAHRHVLQPVILVRYTLFGSI